MLIRTFNMIHNENSKKIVSESLIEWRETPYPVQAPFTFCINKQAVLLFKTFQPKPTVLC